MLVAGDFNSTPGSPAHALLTKGKVDGAAVVSEQSKFYIRDMV
jgi:endonuclease/exonuclease/phosphatase family metal-dependent hydrolase